MVVARVTSRSRGVGALGRTRLNAPPGSDVVDLSDRESMATASSRSPSLWQPVSARMWVTRREQLQREWEEMVDGDALIGPPCDDERLGGLGAGVMVCRGGEAGN